MSRTTVPPRNDQLARQAVAAFLRLSRRTQLILIVLAAAGFGIYWLATHRPEPATAPVPNEEGTEYAATADGRAEFVFASWNVENLFDDKLDKRGTADRPYDTAFAEKEELRRLKYDRLAEAAWRLNNGRGPDVLACYEVESVRAAEMLTGVLNSKATDPNRKYRGFAMKNLDGGRHIAPAVISRLPLAQTATRMHGNRIRVLETRILVNGHELVILATHWTSKLQQRGGGNGESGRENYARTIRTAYEAILRKNPAADVIVCGDFNCEPQEEEVAADLKAVGDVAAVKASLNSDKPLLLDLMAGKNPREFGTLYYNGKPLIYDHICVSPGMLDAAGWGCDPASVRTERKDLTRRGGNPLIPWRFGDPDREVRDSERGYADHFPVTVRLTLEVGGAGAKPE